MDGEDAGGSLHRPTDPARLFPPLLSDEAWKRVAGRHGLTRREQQVAALLCRAASYADVCRRLEMSRPTLRSHVRAAYRKIGCRGRIELVLRLVHEFR